MYNFSLISQCTYLAHILTLEEVRHNYEPGQKSVSHFDTKQNGDGF